MSKSKHHESSSWLTFLKDELAMIGPEDLIEPTESEPDTENGETLVGVASLEIQKLLTYVEKLEEASTRNIVDARFTRKGVDAREALTMRSYEMATKAEAARQLLFVLLRDEFDLWNPMISVGIRKGFQIVTKNRELGRRS